MLPERLNQHVPQGGQVQLQALAVELAALLVHSVELAAPLVLVQEQAVPLVLAEELAAPLVLAEELAELEVTQALAVLVVVQAHF